jgi:anaerobic selenocysteine-containing dehydrogenase
MKDSMKLTSTSLELKTIKAVCPHDCPDTCGMVVTVDPNSQIATKLRGDADHPFTQGFLCAKVNHYLERVYHPDRLKFPMRRIGAKGEGKFERISWQEAIQEISTKLKSISQKFGPQSILPYSYAGTMGKIQGSSLDRRFFHKIGASLLDRTICATAGAAGCDITLGTRAVIDPEQAIHSRFIVNWGSNSAVTNVHFWAIQVEARKNGAKLVSIDPHRSVTASKCDWHLPIRPGTDAALALAVMHVIFRDGLQDDDYLKRFTVGADELRTRVLKEYSPEHVAKITCLPAKTIEQFATEYATTKPALIRLNYGLQRHGGGGMAVRTISCLPAITGDWRHPAGGALLSTSKLYQFDANALERPDLIPPNTRIINMTKLAEALTEENNPPVKALVVYNSNPAAVCPDLNRVRKGLMRDDLFTVVLEHFQTDTADYADIVLPATTQLEHFDVHSSYGHLYVQANPPSIPPLGESKPNTEIFRLLAKAMGLEPKLFEQTDEQIADESLKPLGLTHKDLSNGPVRLKLPQNWAPFAQGGFGTPDGKCHLSSSKEKAAGRDPLPYYIPPHEDPQTKPELAKKYPLQMITPPTPTFLNSTFVNVDHLQNIAREPIIEINPEDASRRSIKNEDMVTIKNDRGQFRAKAIVTDSVQPGVTLGYGIWWPKLTSDKQNVNSITSTALTDFGAGGTFYDNLVEISL